MESLKMNDFWPRGPNNSFQPMMDQADYMSRNNQPSGFNNNNNPTNDGVIDLKDHLMSGQENSGNFNQSTSGFQMNQQQQQQQPPPPQPVASPGAENSHEAKFNGEKFVNEIQQLSRSNNTPAPAISERTLEECWSRLQAIFYHKSAMQMQHAARDIRNGGPPQGGMGGEIKPHQCQQCLKSFSSNHQLVQHIRVHTGEKPYKCTYCDRRFKQLSHVQQHTRLHTGERPYKCHLPDCGRAFIQLSNLQQHLRNHDAQVERAKNRPFHCNICGKGFATESSLRTHTSKELQLHLGVLQQHAALIGGPNATSCLICHKLFLGAEALMEHMKLCHKQEAPQPTAIPTPPVGALSPNDQFNLAKRRVASHVCQTCGKSYVNEGSLRKHLSCHPETSQLASNLRIWPCSVCQAVFTHEAGLLTHMEHMRMDPKHQFAAQIMLSRAAAESRERREQIEKFSQNSRGNSPASDTSSCNGRLSASPALPEHHNNQNNMNENSDNNNNNNNPANVSNNLSNYNGKLSVNDVNSHLQQAFQHAAAQISAHAAQNQNCNGLGSNPDVATSVAVLAAAMRQNQPMANGNQQSPSQLYHQNNQMHHLNQEQPQPDAALRIQELVRNQALRLLSASNSGTSDLSRPLNSDQYRPYHHHQGSNLQQQFLSEQALRLGSELQHHP